jgi:hypothetical protein
LLIFFVVPNRAKPEPTIPTVHTFLRERSIS